MLLAAAGAFAFAPAGSPAAPTQPAEAQTLGPGTGVDLACTATGFLYGGDICDGSVASPEDKQDALSLYQAALQTDSSNNQWFDLLNNQLETSKEVAWMRAERAAARAATNGSTQSAANIDVTESLNEYYSIHEANLIDKWNLLLTGANSYRQQAGNVSGYGMWNMQHFNVDTSTSNPSYRVELQSFEFVGTSNTTHTLPNGNDTTVKTLDVSASFAHIFEDDGSTRSTETQTWSFSPVSDSRRRSVSWSDSGADSISASVTATYLKLLAPDTEYDARNYLSLNRFISDQNSIRDQLANMTNETDTFVSNVYPALESGEVDPEDLVSNVNRMFNYATQGGANATYSEAYIALASMGLDPAGNSSYLSLTYQHDGVSGNVTNDGMLLSDTAPGGSWDVGRVYDSANISGPQMVVTLDGAEHTINGTFQINGAYQDDGTEIANPTLDAPGNDYAVSNTTEAQQLVRSLTEKINRYHNLTANTAAGGGGGGVNGMGGLGGIGSFLGGLANSVSGFLGIPLRQVIVIAGVLGLAVVILR